MSQITNHILTLASRLKKVTRLTEALDLVEAVEKWSPPDTSSLEAEIRNLRTRVAELESQSSRVGRPLKETDDDDPRRKKHREYMREWRKRKRVVK